MPSPPVAPFLAVTFFFSPCLAFFPRPASFTLLVSAAPLVKVSYSTTKCSHLCLSYPYLPHHHNLGGLGDLPVLHPSHSLTPPRNPRIPPLCSLFYLSFSLSLPSHSLVFDHTPLCLDERRSACMALLASLHPPLFSFCPFPLLSFAFLLSFPTGSSARTTRSFKRCDEHTQNGCILSWPTPPPFR